jgi:plastocyanin
MRHTVMNPAVVVLALAAAGCGGYVSGPTQPDASAPPPAGAIVINIVAERGAQSFSPDPATVPSGQIVVWHNVDNTTHHVVLDNRGIDTGDIAPGAFSAPMTLTTVGPYHCTIHPAMVGSIKEG